MSISFNGKVYLTGSTNLLTTKKELKYLKKFAKQKDCDVVVLDRDYYAGDTGRYHTLLVKNDPFTGDNRVFSKMFDFGTEMPANTRSQEINIFG
jgi:hypothetical protein